MELREQIRQWANWSGWRRHAPAAGSVVAHAVVGLAVVGLMGAVARPAPPKTPAPTEAITVELLADGLPIRPPPKPAPRAPREKAKPQPEAPATPSKDAVQPALPSIATEAPSGGSDSVWLGPSPFARQGPTGGLQGLASIDPCMAKKGIRPKDCTNWAARVGAMDSVMPQSKKQLAQHFGEFIPKCPLKTGCEPTDGVLNNGARSFGLKSPMASGPGGVQGINELVGRLGFNPDHTDPGFGD